MADDQRAKEDALEREARRLEKLRSLRLVEQLPSQKLLAPAEVEVEPKDAA